MSDSSQIIKTLKNAPSYMRSDSNHYDPKIHLGLRIPSKQRLPRMNYIKFTK